MRRCYFIEQSYILDVSDLLYDANIVRKSTFTFTELLIFHLRNLQLFAVAIKSTCLLQSEFTTLPDFIFIDHTSDVFFN